MKVPHLKKEDKQQLGLNILAFILLLSATGGKGSFWGFATFTLLSGINLTENLLSKDRTTRVIWIVKTITYSILCVLLWFNKGEFKWLYVIMISISGLALLVSRHLITKRAIAMWGSNASYCIAAYLYIGAILQNPEQFGLFHILFWLVNIVSYVLVINQIRKEKIDQVRLIIPVFAFFACLVYIIIILVT